MALPRCTPSEAGVAAGGIERFIDAVERFEMHGLLVLERGQVVAEAQWAPYRLRDPVLLYSLSKGFTSAAVGLAVAQDLVNLDDRVVDHLPEYADRAVGDLGDLRIRHLLTMSTGHDRDLLDGARDPQVDLVDLLVTTPAPHRPGTWFQYNQPATFTAAAIVQRRVGVRLLDYLRTRLFDRFGAAEPLSWMADARDRDLGFSGLRTDIETVACLGQLLLDDGVWGSERLLPVGWAEQATRAHIGTPREPNPDWQLGYGFQTWMGRHGYRHDGAYGQFCLVFPDVDAVVAVTASTSDMQGLLDEVYRHLLPALRAGGQGADVDAALVRRLSALQIDVPELTGWTAASSHSVAAGPRSSWAPREVSVDDTGLRLMFPAESGVGGAAHVVPCRAGTWTPATLPTSAGPLRCWARGGQQADGTLYATLAVADAPHRLIFRQAGPADPLTLRWNVEPLHGLDPAALVAT